MRFRSTLLPLTLAALGACSTHSGSSPAPGAEAGEGDGSTADCTSIGGTCEPVESPGCPLLDQNPTLCGNVVLVCCLPGSDATIIEPSEDAGAGDAGSVSSTPDATTFTDGSVTTEAASTADAAPHDATTE